MFVNTLVLRTPVGLDQTVAHVLAEVAAADLDAFAHAEVAFEQLVERLSRYARRRIRRSSRSRSRTPRRARERLP